MTSNFRMVIFCTKHVLDSSDMPILKLRFSFALMFTGKTKMHLI